MMNIIISILGIIITILLIVGIHEFGHFIVARLLGVKVLRFSIGFGKKLWGRCDKKGTEYVFAAIPLGGYVKMLDETEGPVPSEEIHLAYNRQPLYKKIAIVLAGPLSNFIFAFILYWLVFIIGFPSIIPVIGKITPSSIASVAGLKPHTEIINIENKETRNWTSIALRFLDYVGEDKKIKVETARVDSHKKEIYYLDLKNWQMDSLKPDPLTSLGIIPYTPEISNVIHIVMPDSPAVKANLQVNDRILTIQNYPIQEWEDATKIISAHPDKTLVFQIQRQNKTFTQEIKIGSQRDLFFKKHGFLGIAPEVQWPKNYIRKIQYSPWDAITQAYNNTVEFIWLNFVFLGKMLTGKVSIQSLGGPITIFESAGSALNIGIIPFMNFLAFISIAIGTINILPIPGLDGGHLLFYFIELIRGRPLSQHAQLLFFRLGFIALIMLLIQAMVNDILRLGS